MINEKGNIEKLESILSDIVGAVKFKVDYDSEKDLHVNISASLTPPFQENSFIPIDLSGTGILQVTQIVAYVVLFSPKILLIDEPDSHLHPSRQSLLSKAFQRIGADYGCKVIISTHSRHLISSAPDGSKIIWVKDGNVVETDDPSLTPLLMDLGALDQLDASGTDILICTEDKGKKIIELAVNSINSPKDIKVISYNGVTNASAASILNEASQLFAKSQPL